MLNEVELYSYCYALQCHLLFRLFMLPQNIVYNILKQILIIFCLTIRFEECYVNIHNYGNVFCVPNAECRRIRLLFSSTEPLASCSPTVVTTAVENPTARSILLTIAMCDEIVKFPRPTFEIMSAEIETNFLTFCKYQL